MDPKMPKAVKPKRRKKSQSRTEVTSISDSESDTAPKSQPQTQSSKPKTKAQPSASASLTQTTPAPSAKIPLKPTLVKDTALAEKFTGHYLQRATNEFSDDLDKIRGAEDFNGNALQILVHALKQGTEVWGEEEMRRVVG